MNTQDEALGLDDLTETAQGIFYSKKYFVTADRKLIDFLKAAARRSPLRRARLCAHPSPDAIQHDMLIVTRRESYVAPHRHPAKTETFVVLEGACKTLLFDANGAVADVLAMADADSGMPFFYRMPAMTYHALDIQSEYLVFVESALGPFDPAKTENAPWAPAPDQIAEGKRYIADVLKEFGSRQL
jgi:cupin fold WbuC family metalloprotein